jgi:hypothetical protein
MFYQYSYNIKHKVFHKLTLISLFILLHIISQQIRDRRGCDCTVFGFTTTYAISANHHLT